MSNPELEQVVQSHPIDIVFPHKREISSDIAEKLLMDTMRKIRCHITYEITKKGVIHCDTQKREYGLSMSGTIDDYFSGHTLANFVMLPSNHQDLFYGLRFFRSPNQVIPSEIFPALTKKLENQIKEYFE